MTVGGTKQSVCWHLYAMDDTILTMLAAVCHQFVVGCPIDNWTDVSGRIGGVPDIQAYPLRQLSISSV